MNKYCYRVEEGLWSDSVELRVYQVTKETPCGVKINVHGKEKFICNHWKKKFASPTVDMAKDGFKRRKIRQVTILEANLASAKKFADMDISELSEERKSIGAPTLIAEFFASFDK